MMKLPSPAMPMPDTAGPMNQQPGLHPTWLPGVARGAPHVDHVAWRSSWKDSSGSESMFFNKGPLCNDQLPTGAQKVCSSLTFL